jgi:hypothetical protein
MCRNDIKANAKLICDFDRRITKKEHLKRTGDLNPLFFPRIWFLLKVLRVESTQ